MTDNEDQLRKAFETHENLAPDPAAVYARVQDLARGYQRPRWGAHAVGGAVLSAGLIAGAIHLPGLLPGNSGDAGDTVSVAGPAAPTSAPAPVPTSQAIRQKEWDAYFTAGYDYNDAVKLARLWHSKARIGAVKAEAGRRLLAGQTLPFKPSPANVAHAQEEVALNAFFAAGYDYYDAVKLAKIWKKSDPFQVKILAGKRLLAGHKLPIRP